jgi:hypothetical protein
MLYYICKQETTKGGCIMDMIRLMEITGMTMKELHQIPKVALYNIINALEDRLYGTFMLRKDREEVEYQIMCYNELMLTAR